MSGQDVVRQIENLPVDRNSRPLEEPTIRACGELVKQVKGKCSGCLYAMSINLIIFVSLNLPAKKEKKKKKSAAKSDSDSDSSSGAKKKKKEKSKKKSKKSTKEKK